MSTEKERHYQVPQSSPAAPCPPALETHFTTQVLSSVTNLEQGKPPSTWCLLSTSLFPCPNKKGSQMLWRSPMQQQNCKRYPSSKAILPARRWTGRFDSSTSFSSALTTTVSRNFPWSKYANKYQRLHAKLEPAPDMWGLPPSQS